MFSKRQLVLTAALLVAGILAINAVVAVLTRNSVPRRVMRHARESRSATVMALGNSLVAAGFNEPQFDAAAGLAPPQGAVNLGLGASSPVEQLLLLRYALAGGTHPQTVIYGFYDFQLTAPLEFSIGDIIGNRAMLYYVEPFFARRFYTLSRHDAFEFAALHAFPMFADRGAIWAKVEILRRRMAQQGMPPTQTNKFGRTSDFSLLESDNPETFRQQCEHSLDVPFSPAVAELLQEAAPAGINVVVVEMPMRHAHRDLFYDTACWQQYRTHIQGLLASQRASFVNASDWITDDLLFDDPLHLSQAGAEEFSRRLGSLLREETPQRSVANLESWDKRN